MRRMSSYGFVAAILLACVLTFSGAQTSCKERCGSEYYRGYMCQCDYNCLLYGECCKDYESQCTLKNSCKGRCGETFKRGRLCSCDSECVKYNQCCSDYKMHCNKDEEVDGEESVAAPAKPDSCDDNVKNKPTDPTTTEATEQPISEGNDPDDSFIPIINPTSYPQDDPDSAAKQIFHNGEVDGPDPSPLPESTSGFGSTPSDLLEDFTTGPPLPDLDGFEILPEPVTVQPETQTTPSEDETTPADTSATTVEPSTAELTTDSTALDVDDQTIPPESTTVNLMSTQPTPEPTSVSTDVQTEPTQPEEIVTGTTEPTVPSSEMPELTTLNPEITPTSETAEESTTATHLLFTTENIEPSSTVPPTTNGETTSNPEMTTTDSTNPPTLAPVESVSEVTTMATTNAELDTKDVTTTAQGLEITQSPSSPTSPPKTTSKPEEKPKPEKPLPFKPVIDPDNKPVLNGLNVDDPKEYQADDRNDTDLCSGRPVSGVTTLSNGTVVVFRGHFFWILDRNQVPGPARGITQVWGIPSPIDTVFTRCNCQGKTYIFKGPQYWRFENDALDPGYPKVIETGFDGLRGHITAALSVPQYNRRKESVYFFKRGGTVQKYSYQFGTNPSCGRKVHYAIYRHGNRIARQVQAQVSLLEPAINIRTSWRGFPTTITAAVSIPNKREPEGYSYHVFSRSKSYRIRMDGERPVVATPKPNTSPQNSEVFKCPKKVSQSQ